MKVYAVFQDTIDDWDARPFTRYMFINKEIAEQCADILREEDIDDPVFDFFVREYELYEKVPEEAFLR